MKGIENIKKILSKHRDELRREYKIIEIGIFGSYIRSEQKRLLRDFSDSAGSGECIAFQHNEL